MFLTICTPAYNRGYSLPDLYNSLRSQTCKDFEWVVVDDGSTDNTESLVREWIIHENSFPVSYYYKENGGKHTALNCGIKHARGECLIIVDSDDMLTPDAVEQIVDAFSTLPQKGMAGVGFNRVFSNGKLVGTTFSGDYVDASTLERPQYNIGGDKAEVFWTKVLKEFPFPVFEGERFLPEALVWNRIAAAGYKLRWYNKSIYICEYRLDGLSMNASFADSFEGYTQYVKEVLSYDQTSFFEKARAAGVYGWNAELKKLSSTQAACRICTSTMLVFVAKNVYRVVRKIRQVNRAKKLNISR